MRIKDFRIALVPFIFFVEYFNLSLETIVQSDFRTMKGFERFPFVRMIWIDGFAQRDGNGFTVPMAASIGPSIFREK